MSHTIMITDANARAWANEERSRAANVEHFANLHPHLADILLPQALNHIERATWLEECINQLREQHQPQTAPSLQSRIDAALRLLDSVEETPSNYRALREARHHLKGHH